MREHLYKWPLHSLSHILPHTPLFNFSTQVSSHVILPSYVAWFHKFHIPVVQPVPHYHDFGSCFFFFLLPSKDIISKIQQAWMMHKKALCETQSSALSSRMRRGRNCCYHGLRLDYRGRGLCSRYRRHAPRCCSQNGNLNKLLKLNNKKWLGQSTIDTFSVVWSRWRVSQWVSQWVGQRVKE